MVFGFAGVTALASIVTGHSGAVVIQPGCLKKTRWPPKPLRTSDSRLWQGFCNSCVYTYINFRVSDRLATPKGSGEVLKVMLVEM